MRQSAGWEQGGDQDVTLHAPESPPGTEPDDQPQRLVCGFRQMLQASGAVATLEAYCVAPGDAWDDALALMARCGVAAVRLRVANEDHWRQLVMVIAAAVRTVPCVSIVVSFAQPGELRLEVFPSLPVMQQRHFLAMALHRATRAVHDWCTRVGEARIA